MSWTSNFCPRSTKQSDPSDFPSAWTVEKWEEEEMCIHSTNEYWKIDKAKYEKDKWEEKLKGGKSASARFIELQNLERPHILKEISHIFFMELRSLYLQENGIQSVEILVQLNAPHLTNLDLRSNRIRDIRSLRKLCSRLDHLFLASNPILDYSPISQIHFYTKPQITYLVNFPNYHNQKYVVPSLRPFFKAQPRRVSDHIQLQFLRMETLEGMRMRKKLQQVAENREVEDDEYYREH